MQWILLINVQIEHEIDEDDDVADDNCPLGAGLIFLRRVLSDRVSRRVQLGAQFGHGSDLLHAQHHRQRRSYRVRVH